MLPGYEIFLQILAFLTKGSHGRDRMAVGFTTTYAISAYPLMLRVRILIRVRCTTLC